LTAYVIAAQGIEARAVATHVIIDWNSNVWCKKKNSFRGTSLPYGTKKKTTQTFF
jgi:hypothetical protein